MESKKINLKYRNNKVEILEWKEESVFISSTTQKVRDG